MSAKKNERISWARDGDQHVAVFKGHTAKVSEWIGPLGSAFVISVDGKGIGQTGGGLKKDALVRAKLRAEERLREFRAAIAA